MSSTATSESVHIPYQTRKSPLKYQVGPKTPPGSPPDDHSDTENPSYISPKHNFGN